MEDRNKISVVLTAEEFERFDAYCTEKGFKKSTLIARLIREHMDSESFRLQTSLFPERPPVRQARRGTRKGG